MDNSDHQSLATKEAKALAQFPEMASVFNKLRYAIADAYVADHALGSEQAKGTLSFSSRSNSYDDIVRIIGDLGEEVFQVLHSPVPSQPSMKMVDFLEWSLGDHGKIVAKAAESLANLREAPIPMVANLVANFSSAQVNPDAHRQFSQQMETALQILKSPATLGELQLALQGIPEPGDVAAFKKGATDSPGAAVVAKFNKHAEGVVAALRNSKIHTYQWDKAAGDKMREMTMSFLLKQAADVVRKENPQVFHAVGSFKHASEAVAAALAPASRNPKDPESASKLVDAWINLGRQTLALLKTPVPAQNGSTSKLGNLLNSVPYAASGGTTLSFLLESLVQLTGLSPKERAVSFLANFPSGANAASGSEHAPWFHAVAAGKNPRLLEQILVCLEHLPEYPVKNAEDALKVHSLDHDFMAIQLDTFKDAVGKAKQLYDNSQDPASKFVLNKAAASSEDDEDSKPTAKEKKVMKDHAEFIDGVLNANKFFTYDKTPVVESPVKNPDNEQLTLNTDEVTGKDILGLATYAASILDPRVAQGPGGLSGALMDAVLRAVAEKDEGKYAGRLSSSTMDLVVAQAEKLAGKKAMPKSENQNEKYIAMAEEGQKADPAEGVTEQEVGTYVEPRIEEDATIERPAPRMTSKEAATKKTEEKPMPAEKDSVVEQLVGVGEATKGKSESAKKNEVSKMFKKLPVAVRKNLKKTASDLDAIASQLEEKGLPQLAAQIDVVSNTLDQEADRAEED